MKKNPLIVFLYNVEDVVAYGESSDLAAIQESERTAALLIEILRKRGYTVVPIPVQKTLDELKTTLDNFPPKDVFVFNYCDTFAGNNLAANGIARLLEKLGYKHSGSTAEVITTCIRKGLTKQKLLAAGIPTPAFKLFPKASGSLDFNYPAFVKPADDDASVGITHKSVVRNQKEMLERVDYILHNYHQDALVEEFIEGREFAVSIWGNGKDIRVLPIAEMDYSQIPNPLDRILTYESKWQEGTFEFENIQSQVPAELESTDQARIQDVGKRAYIAVGLRDFGRVDIRYRDEIPYVIDINEIPDLGPNDGFSKSTRAAGYSHEDTIEQILIIAMEREGLI